MRDTHRSQSPRLNSHSISLFVLFFFIKKTKINKEIERRERKPDPRCAKKKHIKKRNQFKNLKTIHK